MTEQMVKKLCPKAENISVTADSSGWTVGMKVGLFAQAVGVSGKAELSEQMDRVANLYEELKGMNRQTEYQQKKAGEKLNDNSGKIG